MKLEACASAETELAPGDTLLLFTDGITDAMNQHGREFGEEGLIEVLRAGDVDDRDRDAEKPPGRIKLMEAGRCVSARAHHGGEA